MFRQPGQPERQQRNPSQALSPCIASSTGLPAFAKAHKPAIRPHVFFFASSPATAQKKIALQTKEGRLTPGFHAGPHWWGGLCAESGELGARVGRLEQKNASGKSRQLHIIKKTFQRNCITKLNKRKKRKRNFLVKSRKSR